MLMFSIHCALEDLAKLETGGYYADCALAEKAPQVINVNYDEGQGGRTWQALGGAIMAMKPFVKRVFTIFATNASFLRVSQICNFNSVKYAIYTM